jgi:hypothetical protein
MRRGRAVLFVVVALLLAGCVGDRFERWEPFGRSSRVASQPPREQDLLADEHISGDTSAIVVVGGASVIAALLVAAAGLSLRSRRRARAERAASPVALLADGPAVVTGVVELEPGAEGPAAEARVYQRGREQLYKGNWSHSWTESSREVWGQPFHLRRDDGLVVRVEPSGALEVNAPLAPRERTAPDTRTCTAPIMPGARVRVTGELSGSAPVHVDAVYRDAPPAPVLRPPRAGRMVISTEPPGERAAGQGRFHAGWATGIAVVAAILACGVLPGYLALALDGDTVNVQPEAVRRRLEWHKPKNRPGYWVDHYEVRAVVKVDRQPVTLHDDCGAPLYACVKSGSCGSVPFVVASHAPETFQAVGPAPTITAGRAALYLLALAVLSGAYAIAAASRRPWYRRTRIVDSASGRLG